MTPNLIRVTRRVVGLFTVAFLATLVAFALFTHVEPLIGRELFTITGGSMEPTIPIGSLVAAARTDPMTIDVGDIVTIRADNAVAITHRVTQVVDRSEGRFFELKGDANADPDASLVPARALVGRVGEVVPLAGYLRTFLSTTPGLVGVLALVSLLSLINVLLGMADPKVLPVRPVVPANDVGPVPS
jgi:signal peptidase I